MKKTDSYANIAKEFKKTKSHDSYTVLYHKMRPGLKSYINNIVKDIDVTNDILTRTFEKIFTKIEQFNPDYAITTWAYSIAYRECLRWIKKERNKKVSLSYFNENGGEVINTDGDNYQISLALDNSNQENAYTTEAEHWENDNFQFKKYNMTVNAIDNLPEMYKFPLIENLFNGLKYKEIAFKLDDNLNSLNNRINTLSSSERQEYHLLYKKILQRVKNRIRRAKMLVEKSVNLELKELENE